MNQELLTFGVRTPNRTSWFTQSALDIGFKWLEDKYPGSIVYLFSGIIDIFVIIIVIIQSNLYYM